MKYVFQAVAALSVAILIIVAIARPDLLGNINLLGGLLLLEALVAAIWVYDKWFFLILMLVFLWAGSSLPLAGAGSAVRWVFLLVGGLVGVARWGARQQRRSFNAIHLIAALCVLAAVASALVSTRTQLSLLKTGSLLLLFLYASCGARVAVANREDSFFKGLILACEAVAFLSAFSYLALRYALFGNPNALGAIMGVAVVPVLSWSLLIAEDRAERHRRTLALVLAGYLLLTSWSRAGQLACVVTLVFMCIALRRTKLLAKGALALTFMVAIVGVFRPAEVSSGIVSFAEQVVYKGKADHGILESRKSPWQDTVAAIKDSPWFGTGFGTDRMLRQLVPDSSFRTIEGSVREHGSSYMALLQYVGLLGVVPFALLLLLVIRNIFRTYTWMRRTRNPVNYALPLAMVCLSGLLHAAFEDWMFAVGYYLALFFWTSAFLLVDFLPHGSQAATSVTHPRRAMANESRVAVFAGEDALIH